MVDTMRKQTTQCFVNVPGALILRASWVLGFLPPCPTTSRKVKAAEFQGEGRGQR